MPLQLIFVPDGVYPQSCILDPEAAFMFDGRLVLDENSVRLVREIEDGELNIGAQSVLTKTGLIRLHDISTGCKVALLLNSGLEVTMRECGVNAIYEILCHCNKGVGYFEELADSPVGPWPTTDVVLNGIHYTRLWDAAEAMFLC